jgi:hypothetical protein
MTDATAEFFGAPAERGHESLLEEAKGQKTGLRQHVEAARA